MKIIGFSLIICASFAFGLKQTEYIKNRLVNLNSFIFMLELIEAELNSNICSIPELTEKIIDKLEGDSLTFMQLIKINLSMLGSKSFSAIWKESLSVCSNSLKDKEYEALDSLGQVLGKYEIDTQTHHLEECLKLLRKSEEEAAKEFPQSRQLNLGVSVSAGLLMAILLV